MTKIIALRTRLFLMLFAGLVLTACTDAAPKNGGDILVLGDSVMAWNGSDDHSIGDLIGKVLNRQVVDKSVPGAKFSNDSPLFSAIGFDIRQQYPGGRWNWVVMDGGANDLGFNDCKCGACTPVVDRLIAPDAHSGDIPTFIEGLRRTGAQVLWMGYYAGNGKGSFEGCRDDLVLMERRIARYAAHTSGVTFLDAENVIDRTDPTMFASDNTHPSAKASNLIGTYLAKAISARDNRSH